MAKKKASREKSPPPELTPWDRIREFRRHRKLKREARYLVKETRRILKNKKRRAKVGLEIAQRCEEAADALEAIRKAKPFHYDNTKKEAETLEHLIDQHLAWARKSSLREYAEAIGLAAMVAILLRFFVVEPFKIPSGSMIPTLEVGDHIFVNKFSYGLRIPFTKSPPRRFFSWGNPDRGDVVVFIHKKKPDQDFIKRVVAVGGDSIKVISEVIYLKRGGKGKWKKIDRELVSGACSHMDKNEHDATWYKVTGCTRYKEQLGDEKYATVYVPTPFGQMRDYPPLGDFQKTPIPVGFGFHQADKIIDPYHVPKGTVFVMGDNRRNSTDSRDLTEVGFIDKAYIKGRAMVVWWSWGPESFRWGRLGTLIH